MLTRGCSGFDLFGSAAVADGTQELLDGDCGRNHSHYCT